ncbi:IS110 family transposase [Caloramator proteoclasticus]|jgi:transposase|uniref:Transposase IS116/IS110/IS902 family protein n=1 Tax=Caloramator proteoclasticus DSM 10124 TaxID=1121262 RepID=A0A1M4V2A4_9CLOT|nr:IS110 family transposase [Caloramator proteoclasticus]SHE63121.1 Transposase IS116/IS110/IS902 family protein [Caloramator proteoclasticus DSM 10124]
MNYNQNKRIMQINEQTLIIGIDIAKEKHVARAQDFRGIEYGKALNFTNDNKGFIELYNWMKKLCAEHGKNNVIVGMEPTGHYWFCLAKFLTHNGIKVAIVNPMHVKKSKELDDNSPTKNDTKDAKVIAQLVKDGRFAEPNLPQGIYADLRIAMDFRDILIKELNSVKARIARWLDIYFPEFEDIFSSWEGKTALLTLRNLSTPSKIVKSTIEDILKLWKTEVKRAVGVKRAELLMEKAQISVGVTEGLEMAEYELQYLLDKYDSVMLKLNDLLVKVEAIISEIPGAKEMLLIPGLGLVTVAGFLSEVCELTQYAHPRQIQKLAGLTLKEHSSGKHKGQTTITKRGRRKLRALLFKAIMPLVAINNEFKALHKYYTTRANNPLKKKQSLIALCCKLIRVLYAIGTKGVHYNPQKFINDIKHPEVTGKVA